MCCSMTSREPKIEDTMEMENGEPKYSADLFKDLPDPFTSALSLPQLSYEEELKQRPDNEFYRALRKVEADVRATSKRAVEALGFSSWEEKGRHDREEERKWLEEYIKQHGHSPPPPILTEEQKIALELQCQRSSVLEREPCECEEHLHPKFCRERLISYKSQGDDPSDFHFLQSLHPTSLSVCVDEVGPSKRIPDWRLEQCWDIPTQDKILRLPQWARRDETVQLMIDKEEVDETIYHGDYHQNKCRPPDDGQNKNHPPDYGQYKNPLPSFNSIMKMYPDYSAEDNAKRLREFERHYEPHYEPKRPRIREDKAAGLSIKQASPKNTTQVNNAHGSPPAGPTTELSRTQSHSVARPPIQRTKRGCSREVSALGVNKTKRVSPGQVSGIKKRSPAMRRVTRKPTLSDRIKTRAQGVLKFWALDSSGCATSFSRH